MDAFMLIVPQMKKHYTVNKKQGLAMVHYILCSGLNQRNICICISF